VVGPHATDDDVGEVPLVGAAGLPLGLVLGAFLGDVVAGRRVAADLGDVHHVQGGVHLSVAGQDLGTTYARVIPDLVVDLPTGQRIPADAKYKRYDDRRADPGDVYQAFLYAFAYAHPAAGSPASLILYPATSGSAGFRLAIQNTSGLRGARIAGLPVDIERALQRRHHTGGTKDGTLPLAPDDPLATVTGASL
jgi:hypothetical protein